MEKEIKQKKRLSKEQARQRSDKALQLLMANYSYEDIALQLGFRDASVAFKSIDSQLDKCENETIEKRRQLDSHRLDELLAALWPKAIYPGRGSDAHKEQLESIKVALQIMSQRAALLGLNVNQVIEAKFNTEKRFTVIWNTPVRLPLDQQDQMLKTRMNNGI